MNLQIDRNTTSSLRRDRSQQTLGHSSVVALVIVLLLAGFSILTPFIISRVLPAMDAVKIEKTFVMSDSALWVFVIETLAMVIIIALRQNELAVTMVIATKLYIDWYLGLAVISHLMTLALLLIFFLARSPQYRWAEPRVLWLWFLLLVLAILPAFRGINLLDGIGYYLDIIVAAMLIFWLGIVIAQDAVRVRRFLKIFSFFGALIAIHVIIEATTGVFLFKSTRYDLSLTLVADNLALGSAGVNRIGSFLVNPDTSGGFFAVMPFLPLGLFTASSSFLAKAFYLAEVFLMLLALLFTYSTGGWIAACVAFIVFVALVGGNRHRILLPLFVLIVAGVIAAWFPLQVDLQLQHSAAPDAPVLRIAAWQTGIQVIRAFPLTGIGLGRYVYIERADPYRVPGEYIPLYHPHNLYLELGALGGLPILLVFTMLLVLALCLALRNWVQANLRIRCLLGGGIAAVVALSINSLVNPAWTIAPLASIGWLVLGVISSPLLAQSLKREMTQEG